MFAEFLDYSNTAGWAILGPGARSPRGSARSPGAHVSAGQGRGHTVPCTGLRAGAGTRRTPCVDLADRRW